MKQYNQQVNHKGRAVKNKLIFVLLPLFLVFVGGRYAGAQTEPPPDFPINDSELVDPDAADFSSDIFSEDFGTDGTNDTTDTTTDTTVDTTTETTDTTATTTVTDTSTGPKENAIFWISFLALMLILQTTRQLLREKHQNDVF